MSAITRIGIRGAVSNFGLIAVIRGPPRAHLPAEEHGKPDQERTGHDQRRCQRLQIGEHALRLLFRPTMTVLGIVTHPPRPPATRPQTPPRAAPEYRAAHGGQARD